MLSLKKARSNYEMTLCLDGLWPDYNTPYAKVEFVHAVLLEKEKGLVLRPRMGPDGRMTSNCTYLYDELYGAPGGYEIHMLLLTRDLKYLTIRCDDIHLEYGVSFP